MGEEVKKTNKPINTTANERKRKTAQGQEVTANNDNHAEEAPAKPAKKVKVKSAGGQTLPKRSAPHPIAEGASAKQAQTFPQVPEVTEAAEKEMKASRLTKKRPSQPEDGDGESSAKFKKAKGENKRGPPLRCTGM